MCEQLLPATIQIRDKDTIRRVVAQQSQRGSDGNPTSFANKLLCERLFQLEEQQRLLPEPVSTGAESANSSASAP